MKADELLSALATALGNKKEANKARDVRKLLGLSTTALVNWRRRKNLTPRMIAGAMLKVRAAAVAYARRSNLKAIVEMFPLDIKDSRDGVKDELFKASKEDTYRAGLCSALKRSKGVYIFYDSRGRALYAGKAKKQSLWGEMKNAFNRSRSSQTVFRVAHPERKQEFKPAHDMNRQPRRIHQSLSELAHFFSAYEVHPDAIDMVEALLVRGFANDLLNARMEKLQRPTGSRKAKT